MFSQQATEYRTKQSPSINCSSLVIKCRHTVLWLWFLKACPLHFFSQHNKKEHHQFFVWVNAVCNSWCDNRSSASLQLGMPSCISCKFKKKSVIKPLQMVLLINIQYSLKSSECSSVYFVVLLGNSPGICFGACLPTWAHALSWTDVSLSGPEAKPSNQSSIMSNGVSSSVWNKSQAICTQIKVSAARTIVSLPPFMSHDQFFPIPKQVGAVVPLQTWPSLLAPSRN